MDLASKRREDEIERNLKLQKKAASAAAEARKQKLEAIRNEIEKCELQVKVADEIIADDNRDLGVALEFSKKILIEKLSKLSKQKVNLVLDKKDNFRNVLRNRNPRKLK